MLADISNVDAIYIVCGRTDMRKSIDGLCAIIQEQFSMNLERNTIYFFCGRKCDRIKALLVEPDGIVLIYKRLTAEGRYRCLEIRMKFEILPGVNSTGSCLGWISSSRKP